MSSTEAPPDLLTLDDWANLDEDVPGEWVDGVLVEEEVPSFIHELLVGILTEQFRRWLGRGGLIAGSESKLAVSPTRGRKPDLSVWFPGSPLPPAEASISRVPPDVAVEIVTPTARDMQRDRVTKHDEYAAFAVRYYWIMDPSVRSLEVFELRAGVYCRVLGVTSGSALVVPGIEGAQRIVRPPLAVQMNLDEVWEEVDDFIRRSAEQNP